MAGPGRVEFREAVDADLPGILSLLADDAVALARGGYAAGATPQVVEAFAAIQRDPNNLLLVGEQGGDVVAVLQMTLIPGLSRGGMRRALVEAVRVRQDLRSFGIGAALMQHAIVRARQEGCGLMQLTSDKQRTRAHDFYVRLGFVASHEGMKLALD
ncbi:GNAT family N-acetyltransferase [Alkalisalibacterium limincola]|uniref:GNAT family N-acetyltransferase n=1 Tax=Alkalisalibacterium limincola TaxID=2699169 RepID=A0A5C8KZ81_9GAMM|nr:GNAT family N-acetyltransferase [Alkalisalibacterium limincola]TXK64927.1 GNAT family N-acetyltransferase [Alkalisalibacterium limincola]